MTPITWYLYGRSGGAKKAIEEIGVKVSTSGSVAAFPDGANDVAVKSLVAEITPVQSGSGDPSPSNVRPISGRTGMTVTRAGKNLYNKDTVVTGYLNASGTVVSNGVWRVSDYIKVNPNETYVASGLSAGGNSTYACTYGADKGFKRSLLITASQNLVIATAADEYYVRLSLRAGDREYLTSQFEEGSTATPYTAYTAQEYPITWQTEAGTIYGGTLNVTTGVLTVDMVKNALKWSNFINKTSLGNYTRGAYSIPVPAVYPPSASTPQVSNIAPYKAAFNEDSLHFYVNANTINMYLPTDTDGDTDIEVCYQIVTPQTYSIPPTIIRSLLGGNTIFTNAGSVVVDYIADTKLYIDNKVAELQALILEN